MKRKTLLCSLVLVASVTLEAQVVITGNIKSKETGESISSATVMVKGKTNVAVADDDGKFSLTVKVLPVTLVVSHFNFEKMEVAVNKQEDLAITLNASPPMNEIIVEAGGDSRIRSRVINMPTSFERIGLSQIRNSAAPDPYDLLGYFKSVSNVQSSLTMNTFSTRGFNGSGSTRVNQLVDGMDNQAPALGFFLANFAGITDLDLESIEVLPGASSGLYGPGGTNGTILINSKNPFKYEGLSIAAKQGVMHVDERQHSRSPYNNFSLRYAKAFNNKFAFKMGAQYLKAKDWLANDNSNYLGEGPLGKVVPGTRASDPNYNGVNVYGDEASTNMRGVAMAVQEGTRQAILPYGVDVVALMNASLLANATPVQVQGFIQSLPEGIRQPVTNMVPFYFGLRNNLIQNQNVSRTGYQERDIVVDPDAKNIKLSGAFHYKLTDKIEAQLMGYWGIGNTVYTGNNRYVLKDIKIGQYKLEVKHPNWFVRAYTTQENAGEAYSATLTALNLNNQWKSHQDWFVQYTGVFSGAKLSGKNDAEAHAIARSVADQERPLPGTSQFKQLLDKVRKTPISETGNGGLFLEKSQVWVGEGQYNLSNKIQFVDVIVGGNVKQYILNSNNTIFIDKPGHPIRINEFGAYTQLTKSLFNDYLKLSFAGRMDKNEDFKTQFTPRATALVKLAKDQNLRFSYQTAYRFPSTQQKYIHLDVGSYTLLGGLSWILDSMNVKTRPVYELHGDGTVDSKAYVYPGLKPEKMRSFEVGYRAFFSKDARHGLLVDMYGYFGSYRDFLGRNVVVQPSTGKVYSTVLNSSTEVKTYGYGLGLDYHLPKNFSVFFNGYSDVISDVPSGFSDYFNTPKYRFNTGIANSGFGKKDRFGFNAMLRWQDGFQWQGELANGPIDSYTTVDAQMTYKFPGINSLIRLGATNVFNRYYKTGCGNPEIGGLYYVSFGFNL
jgi:outer membrane receptor protein involved in Fe transport